MGFALHCNKSLRPCYLCWLWPPGARWSLRSRLLSWLGRGKHKKSEGSGLWYLCSWQPSGRSGSFAHSDPTLWEDKIGEGGEIQSLISLVIILSLSRSGNWMVIDKLSKAYTLFSAVRMTITSLIPKEMWCSTRSLLVIFFEKGIMMAGGFSYSILRNLTE